MHTEIEAKKLFCPATLGCDVMHCVASECMAWRWSYCHRKSTTCDNIAAINESEAGDKPNFDCYFKAAGQFKPAFWVETDESFIKRRTGYCGLAGEE